ncbi:MAG TPA: AAA family ATPase [Streptosporangiaceae bacterium]
MSAQVIVLNGGSSSGKSTIARCLQSILGAPWLVLGVDTLVDAMPASMQAGGSGIGFGLDGRVSVGSAFPAVEAAWMSGIAAMVRTGANVILEEAFLGGADSQRRWHDAFAGLQVLWAGVHCDPVPAAQRELGRSDRIPGMAASQAHMEPISS